MADVRDILDLERAPTPEITRESILGDKQKKKFVLNATKQTKRPEGMHREVFALLYNDNKDVPPLFPTDTGKGYKSNKAKLGMRKARPWQWMPFQNPARTDDAVFYHWRRVTDEAKEYPFAKFNKVLNHNVTKMACRLIYTPFVFIPSVTRSKINVLLLFLYDFSK